VGFTHGESSAALDTTASLINYRLAIQGDSYTLFANNSQILTGALRNYAASGFPYSQPNFAFFGDDTGEADAKVQIGSFNVVVVPEPAGFGLALEGGRHRARSFRSGSPTAATSASAGVILQRHIQNRCIENYSRTAVYKNAA
jgi:hypothetical protein